MQVFFRTFYIHNRETEKSVAIATLVARYCRNANQLLSMQEFGMQRTHKDISPRQTKKCCYGNTCGQVCQKTNQLQPGQGYGMQRTNKNAYKPK